MEFRQSSVIEQIDLALCKENLPPIMQLKKYVFVEQLPKTQTNKVDKKVFKAKNCRSKEFQMMYRKWNL